MRCLSGLGLKVGTREGFFLPRSMHITQAYSPILNSLALEFICCRHRRRLVINIGGNQNLGKGVNPGGGFGKSRPPRFWGWGGAQEWQGGVVGGRKILLYRIM